MFNQKLEPFTKNSKENDDFIQHIVHESTLASNDFRSDDFDLKTAKQKTKDSLEALEIHGGLQSMLAAQMLSIHQLQQHSMCMANISKHLKLQQYYTNTAIKLTNCFVQQANMLAKLQGIAGQKITVERVDVHQGGQAIVGNIQGERGSKEKK